jgi:hypothetical protein
MNIFYLRDNIVGTGIAHVSFDTKEIIPPNGHRLVRIQTNISGGMCAVKKDDKRYTYICKDGQEAIDLKKVTFNESATIKAGFMTEAEAIEAKKEKLAARKAAEKAVSLGLPALQGKPFEIREAEVIRIHATKAFDQVKERLEREKNAGQWDSFFPKEIKKLFSQTDSKYWLENKDNTDLVQNIYQDYYKESDSTLRRENMNTITLYKIEHTKTYMASEQGIGWSLEPYSSGSVYYEGRTLEKADFVLPDKYKLAEDQFGLTKIYYENRECHLINDNGNPVLIPGPNGYNTHHLQRISVSPTTGNIMGETKSKTKNPDDSYELGM